MKTILLMGGACIDRKYTFSVNKKSSVPIYKQIVRGILQKLSEGALKPGMSLPPERELAADLSVSRGTVQKAYEELYHKNILETKQGAGTFVSAQVSQTRMDGDDPVDALITSMYEQGYTNFEIKSILNSKLASKESRRVRIAAIDCNPESLKIIKRQFLTERNMEVTGYLLDDTLRMTHSERVFGDYDLILTTPAHYDDLSGFLDKLKKVSIAPDRKTVVSLASLRGNSDSSSAGILTSSLRFADIIRDSLTVFGITVHDKNMLTEHGAAPEEFKRFVSGKSSIILPPLYALSGADDLDEEIFAFIKGGGRVITFNYAIEFGSLLHIDEMLKIMGKNNVSI